jgi:leucyl-tRNA synthetase
MSQYNPAEIEPKWRKIWEDRKQYKAVENVDSSKKMYVLPQLPYPSGEGLHMGHSEVYTACDIFARYQRMMGKEVLQVIGWDSFGLPAENFAIKTNIHPRLSTEKAIGTFREQIQQLGISIDWERSVGSHEVRYYKFTQWFFLLMLERGLAYRKRQSVNWCEKDKTVLANEQVVNGLCERCGTAVMQRDMEQWFFKITEYADRLLEGLDRIDWPEESKRRQRDWIGRSEGAELEFELQKDGAALDQKLKVFTTAHDTIFGATFMVIAPEHPILKEYQQHINNWSEIEEYITAAGRKSELERQQQAEKTGVKADGIVAINPLNGAELPVFVADYVLYTYGTGAIMAVPGNDERDGEFAQKYGLPVIHLIEEVEGFVSYSSEIKQNLGKYTLINSGEFSGQKFSEARPAILAKLEESGAGRAKVNYRIRDWSISRQRFWGSPIPVVIDPEGNPHPLKFEDLPVVLPDDVDFLPTGQSPLTYSHDFHKGVEEKYGKGWRREYDTLDTFMCSSWYYFRYLDPNNENEFASKDALKWMPIDFYLGGTEHVTGHLLYSRFFTKVLFDAGYINFDEPFPYHRHQGIVMGPDGKRMSKRQGNVVNPTDVIAQYGADTGRVYLMFMGPLEQDKSWNENAVAGVKRFLSRVWDFSNNQYATLNDEKELSPLLHKLGIKVTHDIQTLGYNTAIAEFMKVMKELEAEPAKFSKQDWLTFITVLAPFAPFITEELWKLHGGKDSVHLQTWPSFDVSKTIEDEITIVVQVNGKLRDSITVSRTASQAEVEAAARNSGASKYLSDSEVLKTIYVPEKLVNFVVK